MATPARTGIWPRTFPALWQILKQAAADWSEDKAAQMGAALAFYSVLSLAPLVIVH